MSPRTGGLRVPGFGFVLVGCGMICRHGSDRQEEDLSYPGISLGTEMRCARQGGHAGPWSTGGSGSAGGRGQSLYCGLHQDEQVTQREQARNDLVWIIAVGSGAQGWLAGAWLQGDEGGGAWPRL